MSYEWAKYEVVRIKDGTVDPVRGAVISGALYKIEGLWTEVSGKSWMQCNGNPACLHYARRSAANKLPLDNNVLYGKIGALGHLVHISEIEGLA